MTGAVADIAMLAVIALIVRGGAWIGGIIDRRTGKRWLAWMAGITVAGAIFAVSIPTIAALTGVQCHGADDSQGCLHGD